MEKEEGPGPEPPPAAQPASEARKSRRLSRLSCLRRRRHLPKAEDDSDLSEGFESDSSHNSARASEGSESGSDKSLDGGGTAFDAETDSEMNSQESRSDLGGRHANSVKRDGGHRGRFPIWSKLGFCEQSDFAPLKALLMFQTFLLHPFSGLEGREQC